MDAKPQRKEKCMADVAAELSSHPPDSLTPSHGAFCPTQRQYPCNAGRSMVATTRSTQCQAHKTKADGSIVALNELWKLEYVVLA